MQPPSHQNIVPFLGAYSTTKNSFSSVFDYMPHLNLSEYLRNKLNVKELELVILIEISSACR